MSPRSIPIPFTGTSAASRVATAFALLTINAVVAAEPVANGPAAIPPPVPFEQQPGAPLNPIVERRASPPADATTATQPATRATTTSAGLGNGGASSVNGDVTVVATAMPDWSRIGAAVAVVIGLALLMKLGAGRWWNLGTAAARSLSLRVVGRSVIGHKQQLLLIQVGRRLVLACDSNGRVSRLAEITDPEEVSRLIGEVPTGTRPAFAQALVDAESGMDVVESTPASTATGRRLPPVATGLDDQMADLAGLGRRLAEIRHSWTAEQPAIATDGRTLEASA